MFSVSIVPVVSTSYSYITNNLANVIISQEYCLHIHHRTSPWKLDTWVSCHYKYYSNSVHEKWHFPRYKLYLRYVYSFCQYLISHLLSIADWYTKPHHAEYAFVWQSQTLLQRPIPPQLWWLFAFLKWKEVIFHRHQSFIAYIIPTSPNPLYFPFLTAHLFISNTIIFFSVHNYNSSCFLSQT